jgi:hypothetical protein
MGWTSKARPFSYPKIFPLSKPMRSLMNSTISRAALAASVVFGMALVAAPAQADTDTKDQATAPASEAAPQTDGTATTDALEAPVAAPAPATDEQPEADAKPEEETVTCRSIRLDMSSRRKTRVCRTPEGWRQLNQQR